MDITKMLEIALEAKKKCDEAQRKLPSEGGNGDCDHCFLHEEVRLHVNAEFYTAVSEVTFRVSPCLLLGELAEKMKVRKK